MVGKLLRALTFANVCSFLALTIALGTGTAYAANTIFSTDIVDGEVKTVDLASNAVTSAKIKAGGVAGTDLAGGAVSGAKVTDGSLTLDDLAGADVNGGGISVPTGYVPNGRCRQLDASVGGATAGEAVVFSIQAPVQDGVVIYGQRVPADGHVTFDVCNLSGTTQAAITNLPVRLITLG